MWGAWMRFWKVRQFYTERRPNLRIRVHNALMDIPKILGLLRDELANLNEAIATLERMQTTVPRRRGRPPRWLTEAKRSAKSKANKEVI